MPTDSNQSSTTNRESTSSLSLTNNNLNNNSNNARSSPPPPPPLPPPSSNRTRTGQISYAYGAPYHHHSPLPFISTSTTKNLSHSPSSSSLPSLSTTELRNHTNTTRSTSIEPTASTTTTTTKTGRPHEPASVRYSRLKEKQQRQRRSTSNPTPEPQSQSQSQSEVERGEMSQSSSTLPEYNKNKNSSNSLQRGTTGGSNSSNDLLRNTSVNIATAFRAATSGLSSNATAGGVKVGSRGRREDFPPLGDDDDEGEEYGEGEHEEEEGEMRGGEEEKRGKASIAAIGCSSKKRKKRTPKDPSFRPDSTAQSSSGSSGEGSSEEYERSNRERSRTGGGGSTISISPQNGRKRVKVRGGGGEDDDEDMTNDHSTLSSIRKKPSSPRKSTTTHRRTKSQTSTIIPNDDAPYRPSTDPHYHAGNTSTSESSDDNTRRRSRRSKSLGGGVDAIPRGIRDGEVWYGKGKKKRKSTTTTGGKRGSSTNSTRKEEEESVESVERQREEEEAEEEEDMGGMGDSVYYHDDDQPRDEEDQTPPALPGASYFLRLKSPSPPQSSTSNGAAAAPPSTTMSNRTSGWGLGSLSPFRSTTTNPRTATEPRGQQPSPDPAFAAFDRSLHSSQDPLGEDDRSRSIEGDSSRGSAGGGGGGGDSSLMMRNSSYDYSEEERIVQALESDRKRQQQQQQQSQPRNPLLARVVAQHGGGTPSKTSSSSPSSPSNRQPPETPVGMTPAPKSGAYPLTPGSPVNGILRNRFGHGNGNGKNRMPAPPSMLGQQDDQREGSENVEGGEWGRKVGKALRPVVEIVTRLKRKCQDPLLDWGKILKAVAGVVGLVTLTTFLLWNANSTSSHLPFLSRSSPPPSSYTPPATPPDSLTDLISRLSSLESAVGHLSTSTDTDRLRSDRDRTKLSDIVRQVEAVERNIEVGQASLRGEVGKIEALMEKRDRGSEKVVERVKEELESLVGRVEEISNGRETDSNELKTLQRGIESVSTRVSTLTTRLDDLSDDVERGLKEERIIELALKAIEQKLPGKVGVRLDSSGRLEIDPMFWKYLKDAFVDRKQVDKAVDTKIRAFETEQKKKASSSGGGGLFGSKEKEPSQIVVQETKVLPPSWDDFLSTNEDALRDWIASDLSNRSGGDAFVSKKTFLDLLQREIKSLKRDFESKANDNFEQMGRELLQKVAKQEEMRKKDQAWAVHHRQPPVAAKVIDGPVTIKSIDGQNVTAVISSLVDSALLRYSKDVIARPDYALFTAGGRVIRSLTSRTYEPHPLRRTQAALAWITGNNAPRGRPAVTALHPDTTPGSCWPFEGSRGQIGIQLSRRIVPTDITLEHISKEVALDGDVSSAPKDFEVWAVVEGQEYVERLAKHRRRQIETKRASKGTTRSLEDELNDDSQGEGNIVTSVPPSPNHLLIAVGTYDPHSSLGSPVQTFPVTSTTRQLEIPVQIVVVKFLSNHGEDAYTCLYRVRVSGKTLGQISSSPSTSSSEDTPSPR